jgi:hypothetical protein
MVGVKATWRSMYPAFPEGLYEYDEEEQEEEEGSRSPSRIQSGPKLLKVHRI